jgi:hypothetical protein
MVKNLMMQMRLAGFYVKRKLAIRQLKGVFASYNLIAYLYAISNNNDHD